MVAIIVYTLAAVGAVTVVASAGVLYACVRLARQADSDARGSVSAFADDSHDPRLAQYVNGVPYSERVRR